LPDPSSSGPPHPHTTDNFAEASKFYHWASEAEVAVQHILYSTEELTLLFDLMMDGHLPNMSPQMLFVLGRHTENEESDPASLLPFLKRLQRDEQDHDWAVCAFGHNEIPCLIEAAKRGGKSRIGF
jgi:uncharacterized protein (DUF849 family)